MDNFLSVYEYDLQVEYGDGILLISAKTKKEADKIAAGLYDRFSETWKFSKKINGLYQVSKKPKIIIRCTYIE